QKLDKLGKQFSLGVMVICLLIFLLGLFRGQPWEALLLLAVSVAVSGIPESLPAVIAVALSIGIKRMAAQNAIVKKLSAVETLGTCTVICTDKTGTLTQNKMVVEHVYTYHHEVDVTGQGLSPKGLFLRENVRIDPNRHKGVAKMLEIGLLCNNAALLRKEGAWHIDGESTEGALIVLAQKAGLSREDAHERCPRVKEHPFDAERKCMSAVHMLRKQPLVYAKGAPEILLAKCDRYYDNGRVHRMTASVRQHYLEKTQAYASQGKRVLGLAFKEHKGKSYELRHVESQLVFAGLVAMRDPPEAGAKEAVAECHAAGTLVVMITGDNRDTALAIAQELGIHRRGDGVLSGPELDDLDDNKFSQLVGHTTVYARTTPKHKMRIVSALQEQGHIVAMTGDGVNDAPALRKADIGVAMGRTGTDVAKEAADMVIKDDNFRTIVTAIREGRTIYTNIRRFIYYLLAGNFSEVILILIAALLGVAPVLTPIMILFVNLVTSDIPALGLCMERPGRHIMHQRPRDPQEKILNEYLFLKISQVVPLIVVGTIGLFIYELAFLHQSLPHAQTVALASLVCFELFHVLNARSFTHSSLEGYNPSVLWGIVLSAMALLTVIYAPYFQGIFGTVPLEPASWVRIVLVSSSVLLLVELQKTFLAAEMNERDKLALQQRAT
ncbi:ATPase, partial [Candidatus Woesearchaeota archaeon CG_4_10_14_0_2_um_filter_57_5]